MIIVWGERLCGRVNQVDNQVHVATKFFHVQYIPLLPLNSYGRVPNKLFIKKRSDKIQKRKNKNQEKENGNNTSKMSKL